MKKILLGTALALIIAQPVWAEETIAAQGAVVAEEQMSAQPVTTPAPDAAPSPVPDAAPVSDAAPTPVSDAAAPAPVAEAAHWDYVGAHSAAHWDGTCESGQAQSPVNVARYLQEDLPDFESSYQDSPLEVVNNGHTVQVNYTPGSGFVLDGVMYELLQFHFHTPSEHYMDGAPYPMEVHFVHKAADGILAVIGAMIKVGAHNPVIEGIWTNVPAAGEVKKVELVSVNAGDLMPESGHYYHYEGSLTTPPCSEGVRWYVMQEPIELSEAQLRAFQSVFPVNARPVQPLNERVIVGE